MYGLLVLMTVIVVGIEAWSRGAAWDNQLRISRAATENITQASAEHAEATLGTLEGLLDGMVERVQTDGVTGPTGERLRRYMVSRLDNHHALQGLFVYDRDGNCVLSTRQSMPTSNRAERAYFIHHRTHADKKAYLGQPIVSAAYGGWMITLSRRVDDAHGNFAGVVLATIPTRYFQRYYERFSVGSRGIVMLASADGIGITRLPHGDRISGNDIRQIPIMRYIRSHGADAGTVMLNTTFDGIERQYSYRRVPGFPLIVGAALTKDEIFAGWWAATLHEGLALLLLLVVIYAVGFWLIAQLRVQERLEATLLRTQAALEARNAELDRQAHTDALTGLSNRRCFDEALDRELARAAREQVPLSLIMIDVDFFKRYNDEYGHAAGDDCLRMIGTALAQAVHRAGDMAARIGGEEFAILLPNTGPDGAVRVAESVRRAVAARRMAHRANPAGIVTISAGVGSSVPGRPPSRRAFVEGADTALYAAKAAGRDRVHAGPIVPMAA